ncbi:MAG TPA: glycosyltransferase [Microbacteriaceae bacterium]|nr:glycosyltransferase [Microbacteriaceae bacterium]
MRVLIGADTFPPDVNGSARFSERLAAGLAARGHEVHVMAPATAAGPGTFDEEHGGQRITVHRLRSWRWYPHDWLRFALPWRIRANSARVLDAIKPDVIHFQSHIIVGYGLSREGAKRGIRLIGTNHFMPENLMDFTLLPAWIQDWAIRLAWRAAGRTFGMAEAVSSPTRRAADFLEKYTGVENVHAISCGLRADNYWPNFEPRTENRITFVGRITGEKQIDVLLKAVAMLPPELDVQVEIVGGGDQLRPLQQLARELRIADRVTFAGYVTEDELRAAYHWSSVLAMPSIAELQSIVTMEAMASALPVVAADAMALPHLVHDGKNGYLFEPGNAAHMAERLERVLTAPPEEYQRMQRESMRIVSAHDIDRTLDTFEALYRGESVEDPDTNVD